MGHKVDMGEVTAFSNDLKAIVEETKANLESIRLAIMEIQTMDSFSGKVADQAKNYFADIHLTLLDACSKLFTDLQHNLEQHIENFYSNVDTSNAARIQSNYLLDIEQDIKDMYEKIEETKQSIDGTINNVADISSAIKPDFTPVTDAKDDTIKTITDLDEKLTTFAKQRNEHQTEDLIHQIQVTMERAGTKTGEARFTDYTSALEFEGLPVLKDYVQTYRRGKMFDEMGLPYTEYKPTLNKEDFYNTEGADGSGIVEWQKNNMEISRGKRVDYDALGINPSTIDLKGYDVNYTMKDGNFIIFKDNPDLKYYTQSAEQGRINYYAAQGTQIVANVVGTWGVAKIGTFAGNKVNALKKAFDKLDGKPLKAKEIAVGLSSYTVQSNIPIWREIVGTSVPKIGSKEVILYISDNDGKTWDGKVRFKVHSDGGITSKEF